VATKYDLHSHSNASDGALNPTELVLRARRQGVNVLALTDHDTTAGLAEARFAAELSELRLINGIELSANYAQQCLHIIGLNIDPRHPLLIAGLDRQHRLRAERAEIIAEKLEKKRIPGAYAAVRRAAGDGEITRSHFADFLVANHYVATQQEAFDRYLNRGQAAYAPTLWAELHEVVAWITVAGGVAVLAHPMRYRLSLKWLQKALQAFKQMGGNGIEVVTGRATAEEIRISCELAVKFQLYASVGSDFHAPVCEWVELGRLADLPARLTPVWEMF
jgi:predicted metal-dependent phosphoesterase TrpH